MSYRRSTSNRAIAAAPAWLISILVAIVFAPASANAATVVNGDFETGTLSGWQLDNSGDPGNSWFAYSGTTSPLFGVPIPAPPQGTFGAITDQSNPGRHLLYQDVSLEPGRAHTLSLYVYYRTSASITSPDNLDFSGGPNQQYRIDVMNPSAALTSVAAGDILLNVFRTNTGDPTSLPPTVMSADLTPFAGQTVRLRFAEVDNQDPFQAGTDAVAISSLAPAPTCKGKTATIFVGRGNLARTFNGTSKADVIVGTSTRDVIRSGGGKDLVCAKGGNDKVKGGSGKDRLYGQSGKDKLFGQAGNDKLVGGGAADKLIGGGGTDTLNGGSGRDVSKQ
jgi:Ca2+-binding RTX toxin-like protein